MMFTLRYLNDAFTPQFSFQLRVGEALFLTYYVEDTYSTYVCSICSMSGWSLKNLLTLRAMELWGLFKEFSHLISERIWKYRVPPGLELLTKFGPKWGTSGERDEAKGSHSRKKKGEWNPFWILYKGVKSGEGCKGACGCTYYIVYTKDVMYWERPFIISICFAFLRANPSI